MDSKAQLLPSVIIWIGAIVAIFVVVIILAPIVTPFIQDGINNSTDVTQAFMMRLFLMGLLGFVIILVVKQLRSGQVLGV